MKNLKALRKKNKISQVDLARTMHVTQTTVSRWETGEIAPDAETIEQLADFFSVSVDYLLGRDTKEGNGDAIDPEVLEYIEELKNRDDLQMLIVAARDVTKEDIEKAIKIIKALKD